MSATGQSNERVRASDSGVYSVMMCLAMFSPWATSRANVSMLRRSRSHRWPVPRGTSDLSAAHAQSVVVLIEPGTGLLAEFGDEAALAQLVAEVDKLDPALCRATAEGRFTPAVMAAAYLELYDRCLTGALAGSRAKVSA